MKLKARFAGNYGWEVVDEDGGLPADGFATEQAALDYIRDFQDRDKRAPDSVDEALNWAVDKLEGAMSEYIVQSQMWDKCGPNNFHNARKELLDTVERVIGKIRTARGGNILPLNTIPF
jgi:hypothetical protein